MSDINYLPSGAFLQGGKYRITRFIGSGGFGCTYEAVHVMLEKKVAVKEFFVKDFCNRDETTSYVTVGTQGKKDFVYRLKQKFVEEAKAICKLHHPGIVSVSDVFEENGTAYYVMDFIEGHSLQEMVNAGEPLPERQALKYVRQVADALKYVHSNNRLHLDIKPGNIMIDGSDRAVLIDFGASKQYNEDSGENSSTVKGMTPGYAPPEQMDGNIKKFMPATDIYSLGATLYKLLTGITPLTANERISGEELAPLPSFTSEPVREAIAVSMQLNKQKRPQSIDEFMRVMDGNAGQPSGRPSGKTHDAVESRPVSEEERPDGDSTVFNGDSRNGRPEKGNENNDKASSGRTKGWIIAACIIIGLVAGFLLLRPHMSGWFDNKDGSQVAIADSSFVGASVYEDMQYGTGLNGAESTVSSAAGQYSDVHEIGQATETSAEPETKPEMNAGAKSETKPAGSAAKPETGSGSKPEKESVTKPENTATASRKPSRQESSVSEKPATATKNPAKEQPFVIEEVDASFQGGGLDAFTEWVRDRLVMPEIACENGIEGTVMIQFTVTDDGNVTDVKVLESVDRSLDNEAVRVVSSSPKWTPARQNGRNVKVSYKIPITFELAPENVDQYRATGTVYGHQYVDLGLSVKWATCNMGAASPSDFGHYYAWGETETKYNYVKDNSVTYGRKKMSDISGNPEYDAVRANWGGTWRLPTQAEMQELISDCRWEWTKHAGYYGYKVTGPNGNSIFLPAASYCRGVLSKRTGDNSRSEGLYWTSTPYGKDVRNANGLRFSSSQLQVQWGSRCYGQSIRPVTN